MKRIIAVALLAIAMPALADEKINPALAKAQKAHAVAVAQCKALPKPPEVAACINRADIRLAETAKAIAKPKKVSLLDLLVSNAWAAAPVTLAPGESITVTAQPGGGTIPPVIPPVTPPSGDCAGFTNTIKIEFNWAAPGRLYSGPMGSTDIVVARFTTGNVDSPDNNLPRVSSAEWGSPPSARYAALSDKPCDFGQTLGQGAISAGNSVQVPFAVGAGSNHGYYPKLLKNTTYYFSIKNLDGQQTCKAQGICDLFVELSKPGGM